MNYKNFINKILSIIKIKNEKHGDLFLFYNDLPNTCGMGFQSTECSYLLNKFSNSRNFTIKFTKDKKIFEKIAKEYYKIYPNTDQRFCIYNPNTNYSFKLAYGIFLNNIYSYIDIFEKNNIPFVFVLYPGGGFALDNEDSDLKLKRVLNSPMFKKVIVTMPITEKYILQKQFCTEEQIEYIYGVIVQNNNFKQKLLYKKDKNTFDICFVAHKYSELGKDKGYDTVIEVAKKVISQYKDIHFHIVGPWKNVIDVSDINKSQLHFYGIQPKDFFLDFYSKMDIYLSPNRYQILQKGNFDGYPLGIEAAYAGVYVMGSDPLSMRKFTPLAGSKGFEVIDNDSDKIVKKIVDKLNNLDSFYKDSLDQQIYALKIFNLEKQLDARTNIINKYLKNNITSINQVLKSENPLGCKRESNPSI